MPLDVQDAIIKASLRTSFVPSPIKKDALCQESADQCNTKSAYILCSTNLDISQSPVPRGTFPIAPGIVGIPIANGIAITIAIAPAAVMSSREVIKMLYLLHFKRPLSPDSRNQHYLGWTDDLDNRIRQHRKGTGSRFCQVAKERGIPFVLDEVIPGDPAKERHLKKQIRHHHWMCPICQRDKQRSQR